MFISNTDPTACTAIHFKVDSNALSCLRISFFVIKVAKEKRYPNALYFYSYKTCITIIEKSGLILNYVFYYLMLSAISESETLCQTITAQLSFLQS